MAKKEKVSFLFSYKYIEYFKDLTGEEVKKLLNDMVEYDKNDVEPNYEDRVLKTIWNLIKVDLKENKDRYKDVCLKNSIKQQERWKRQKESQKNTSVYSSIPNNTNDTDKDIDKDTHIDKDIDIDKDTHIDKDIDIDKDTHIDNLCNDDKKSETINSKNSNYCHLGRDVKIESCQNCLKNKQCPLKTDSQFILKHNCDFEEWLAKEKSFADSIINKECESPPEETELFDYNWLGDSDD